MSSDLSGENSSSIAGGNAGINPITVDENSSVNENDDSRENYGQETAVKTVNNSQEDCNHETESGYNTETETVEVDQESETQDLSIESKKDSDCQQSSKTISYILEPLLYATKYGAKALSATTIVGSYTLNAASYVIAGMSYVPHGASKALEEIKEEDRDTVRYKVITASQNLLDLTSGAMYVVSYVPYGAGMVLNEVSGIANQLDSSLSPEKIEQVCTKSDLFVEDLSSKLKEVTDSSVEAMSRLSDALFTKAERPSSVCESGSKSNQLESTISIKKQEYSNLRTKELVEKMVNTRKKLSELEVNGELKAQINNKLEKRNKTLRDLNEEYKKEFGDYNMELTEFLSNESLESEKLLESQKSDISKPDAPSTWLSILSTPFSYLAGRSQG
ncbi:MAG: hypothetical protein ACR5K9_09585 [Wolbachia sp.]